MQFKTTHRHFSMLSLHTLAGFEAREVFEWEGNTYTQDAVIALLWEGQPNIMGPGRIRKLFSDPVRLYSLFMFLLRLPYHPSAAVSQQVPCVFQKSLNTANGRRVLYVCTYYFIRFIHTRRYKKVNIQTCLSGC